MTLAIERVSRAGGGNSRGAFRIGRALTNLANPPSVPYRRHETLDLAPVVLIEEAAQQNDYGVKQAESDRDQDKAKPGKFPRRTQGEQGRE